MYCGNCGTQIPDQANFCWNCGKPQKQGVKVEEPKWETCEICINVVKWPGTFFGEGVQTWYAKAVGPNGTYTAAESPTYSGDEISKAGRNAFEVLIDKLGKEGWELVGSSGVLYWQRMFRRRLR